MSERYFSYYFWIILVSLWLALLVIILAAGVFSRPSYSSETNQYFNQKFLSHSFQYNRLKLLAYVIDRVLVAAYGFLLFFLGWKYLRHNAFISMGRAMMLIALFLVLMYALTFPVSYWRSFLIERQFGLSEQSLGMWAIDYMKGFIISFCIAFAGLSGLYALIYYFPQKWWIFSFLGIVIFLLLGTILYPLIIAPIFYNFEPLRDPAMEQKIKDMADDAGIDVEHVLVADASRRTKRANAYFTGLGRTKRIVLYDNLVDHFDSGKILAVIAHEMGHWKKMHIFQWFLISSSAFFIFLFGLSRLESVIGGNGFRTIAVIFLIHALLSVIMLPAENLISRRFEREADQISLILTEDARHNINLFIRLAKTNYSNVEPSPWIKYILYSHPPIMERINAAEQYQ